MASATIWKYPLFIQDRQTVTLPRLAQPIHVGDQNGQICLWCKVWPDMKTEDREVFMFGTGHPIPDFFTGTYIGTAQQLDGTLVWHIFIGD